MEPQDSSSPPPQYSAAATAAAVPGKKRRNPPGNPGPDSEVIALSPQTLTATNRFVCDVCHKGFQREQNLQLHRRGHNLPWKLKQKNPKDARRRVYLCPEPTCVHHDPSRALGDLTGIKKHYCRKHGEKKWKCDKCNKRYAVQSDWKARSKTCGTREYRCDCGTLFSRRDSFVHHRALCSGEMPPMGADLYVGSGSMSPGLPGADAQIDGFADQAQSSSAAAAAAAAAAQFDFDSIMPLSPGPSVFHSQELGSSSSFFVGGGALSPAQNFSEYGEHSQGAQGPYLLHDEQPFHGLIMQHPQQQHQPGSSNANGNLLMNLGLFSANGGDSAGGQDPRLVIQDQFNGGGGGGNTEYGSAMAPIGSHLSDSFPSQYHGPSPSAGLPQNYATALLMKAAQTGSTSNTTPDGPSALPRAGGFSAAGSGQGSSRAAGEMTPLEAHFHDLIMNSLPGRRRGFSGGAAWSGAVDDGQLSTRDFLGAMLPPGPHMGAGPGPGPDKAI